MKSRFVNSASAAVQGLRKVWTGAKVRKVTGLSKKIFLNARLRMR